MADQSYYDVLGITQSASADEIKRAWARKMREHPPDKDPAGNQAINEAKQTLLDPQARKQYDKMLVHGDAIRSAVVRAESASEAGNHTGACLALMEILALDPDCHWARDALGLAQHRSGDTQKAIVTLRGLVQRAPDVALYRHNLGVLLMDCEGPGEAGRLQEATVELKLAVETQPDDADYRVALAQALRQAERYDEAEAQLEAALMTDGVLDVQDLEALFELVVTHLCSDKIEALDADAARISVAITDADARAAPYCAGRFADLADWAISTDDIVAASWFANIAARFSPADHRIHALVAQTNARIAAALPVRYATSLDSLEDRLNALCSLRQCLTSVYMHESAADLLATAQRCRPGQPATGGGAVVGGLIGLLAGPLGAAIGAAVGAAMASGPTDEERRRWDELIAGTRSLLNSVSSAAQPAVATPLAARAPRPAPESCSHCGASLRTWADGASGTCSLCHQPN